MAPEVMLMKPYDGKSVDLFAAAVCNFIMYAGKPPFLLAEPTDLFYQLLVNKKYRLFWKINSRKRVKGYFSEEFKDFT